MTRRVNWQSVKADPICAGELTGYLYNSAKRKAAQRGLTFNLKWNDVLRRVEKGKCEATGIPFDMRRKPARGVDLPFRASLDRIDNTRGYEPDNIAVVCKIYNHAKWNWNAEDVIALAAAIGGRCAGCNADAATHTNRGAIPSPAQAD